MTVNHPVRAAAAHVLGQLGEPAKDAVADLASALDDYQVADALNKLGAGDVSLWLVEATLDPNHPACYDSYDALHLAPQPVPVFTLAGSTVRSDIAPLQSRILRLTWVPSTEVSTTHGTVSSTRPVPGRHDPTLAASSIRKTNQENT